MVSQVQWCGGWFQKQCVTLWCVCFQKQCVTMNNLQGAAASVVIADSGPTKGSTPSRVEEPLLTAADFTFHAVTDLEIHAQYIQVCN